MGMKNFNPNYRGFRGYDQEPKQAEISLTTVICTVCARRRNVPIDVAADQENSFVCLLCQEGKEELRNHDEL